MCSLFVQEGKIKHSFVRPSAHTLFIARVLYFPISHSNEHRLEVRATCQNTVLVAKVVHFSYDNGKYSNCPIKKVVD